MKLRKYYFRLIFEVVHLILLRWLVGAISCTHFTFFCGVSEKACIITVTCWEKPKFTVENSPATSWNRQLGQFAAEPGNFLKRFKV